LQRGDAGSGSQEQTAHRSRNIADVHRFPLPA
jgi:hypothetical protein